MSSDRSRRTDRARHGYTGVVGQQGRVILDRDFNALQGLMSDRREAEAIDVIGPCGTPDDGFRISLTGVGSPPQFYAPPFDPLGSPPFVVGGAGDLIISPGTMYIGGQRVVFPAEQNGAPITYSYYDQPDWPSPDAPGERRLAELVYLEVTEQEVSAVEDPDLLDVALGGPDTTQRVKLQRRVRRMPVEARDCASAWRAAVAKWAAQGFRFDPSTMRLVPQARLQVGFTQTASSSDPCDPVATGGYLGADNQLIRVQTVNDSTGANLIWGYDNASFLYRVALVSDGTMLTLANDPPDAFHAPQTGQLVEVLRTAAVLGREPDETGAAGSGSILRVAAEAEGFRATLARPYGPITPGDSTNYIVLNSALPPEFVDSPLPLFLRVWQAELTLPAGGGTVTLADPFTGISTGVNATIAAPGALPDGAFWQVAVRPATPQGVYPEELLTEPQAPHGPRRWVCPLALVTSEQHVTDCRNIFVDLVTLTRRRPGCCSVGISPSDVTGATSLQALIDDAAALGIASAGAVIVCLGPGEYPLTQSLRLDQRHSGMTIESCGEGASLYADASADLAQFADGLVVVQTAARVTLRGLTLSAPLAPLLNIVLKQLPLYTGFGVRANDAEALTLADCSILISNSEASGNVMAAAVCLQGDCVDFTMEGCSVSSSAAPTFTGLEVNSDEVSPVAARAYSVALEQFRAPVASSPPASAAQLLSQRAQASLDVLSAKRATLAVGATSPPVIATVGVLASDYISGENRVSCSLGDGVLRGNRFTGLTVGTWISSIAQTLRVENNVISGGVAGFWLQTPGYYGPQSPVPATTYFPQSYEFEEFLFVFELAPYLQPPASAANALGSSAMTGAGSAGSAAPAQPALLRQAASLASANDFTIFLLGNRFETSAAPDSATQGSGCSAALMLALDTQNTGETSAQGSVAAIISANHLTAASGIFAPTAQIVLAYALPCAITGNIVRNIGPSPLSTGTVIPTPSLWVVADGSQNGITQLSISGNVVNGISDLTQLTRPGQPAGGWSNYNANPS